MSSLLRIGVVGCGYWGPNLIRNFAALDKVRVVAVGDKRPERLNWVSKNFPAILILSTDVHEVLKHPEVDAVVIATPVSTHHPFAKLALENGKHVLVEKPFTATSAEAQELIAIADARKLKIMVDHTFVYTGAIQTIKKYIDSGQLGDLYYFDSVRVNLGLFQHDVNVIWDLAPHDVSIMDYLLGESPRAVSATGVAHVDSTVENIAYMTAFFANNLIGHIHVNWLAPVKVRKTLISGSKKMIIYDDMDPSEKVKIYDKGVDKVETPDQLYNMLIQYRAGDMYAPQIDLTEALKKVANEFVDCIAKDRPALTDGHAGLRVVKILESANLSLKRRGQEVELT
jgi:predicted dehydrogenase